MSDWINKKCQSCSGFSEAISYADALEFATSLPGWTVSSDAKLISRRFEFKNFKQTMFFVNAVAFISESEGHHPDVNLGYNHCGINLTTHELGGLSENDFICAAKINQLLVS